MTHSLTFHGEKYGLSLDPVDENCHQLPKLFEIHAACTSYLAPDFRSLVGTRFLIRVLRESLWYDFERDRIPDAQARLLAALLPVISGIPLRDVLDISLHPPQSLKKAFSKFSHPGTNGQKILGYFCTSEELANLGLITTWGLEEKYTLLRFIGPHSDENFTSRICDQFLMIPMPSEVFSLIDWCRQDTNKENTFARLVATVDPLAGIKSMMNSLAARMIAVDNRNADGWYAKTLCSHLYRGDRAFIYVAAVLAKIPPALLSLMLGRPYGIWRSGSNYASVPMSLLTAHFKKVHAHFWRNLSLHTMGGILPDVGAGLLRDNRISSPGLPTLGEITGHPAKFHRQDIIRSAARLNFAERLLGRRYSAQLPNPSESLLPFFLNSYCWLDKNLSGRTFPRFMPLPTGVSTKLHEADWHKIPGTLAVPKGKRKSVKKIPI